MRSWATLKAHQAHIEYRREATRPRLHTSDKRKDAQQTDLYIIKKAVTQPPLLLFHQRKIAPPTVGYADEFELGVSVLQF